MSKLKKNKKMCLKNNYKIYLRYQSFDPKLVELWIENIKNLSKNVFSFSSIRLPLKKKRLTVLKSPHVNKKSRDQLELRLYNGLIVLKGFAFNPSLLENIFFLAGSDISVKFSIQTVVRKSENSEEKNFFSPLIKV